MKRGQNLRFVSCNIHMFFLPDKAFSFFPILRFCRGRDWSHQFLCTILRRWAILRQNFFSSVSIVMLVASSFGSHSKYSQCHLELWLWYLPCIGQSISTCCCCAICGLICFCMIGSMVSTDGYLNHRFLPKMVIKSFRFHLRINVTKPLVLVLQPQ